jgi:hypothetical protein
VKRWWLCLFLLASTVLHAQPVEIVAEPAYKGTAETLKAVDPLRLESVRRFSGDFGPPAPVIVTLARENSGLAQGAPPWASGYADPSAGVIVLFPARNVRYPDDSLQETYLHELAHIALFRATGGAPVPRWFNEGSAVLAGRAWSLADASRFAWDALAFDRAGPQQVDALFQGDAGNAATAYAVSAAFIRDFTAQYGPASVARVSTLMRTGEPFDRAFFLVTGYTVDAGWQHFWERQTWSRRAIPLLTSGTLLWLLVLGVAMAAFFRKKRTGRLTTELWEAEEELEDLSADGRDDDETIN